MPGPLAGITVLDFTWALAGPYGTMILSDMGADVWKVESPGIDEESRGPGPMVDGVNTYFFSINRGKKSITLDLKSDSGREIALSLAEQADVLCENFSPGTMKRLGLDYEAVAARNPAIIYASTSGFGQTGPYAARGAVDVIVQGMSGLMSITGEADGPPVRAGYSIGDMAGGMYTAIGVLGALVERNASGQGQYLDVSMFDCQVSLLENALVRHCATGEVPGRIGSRHPLVTPFQAFPTSDGWVVVAGVKDWAYFCATLELDDLIADDRFADNRARTRNHAELEPLLARAFQRGTTAEWLERLGNACLIGPLQQIDEVAADPHVAARSMLVDLPAWTGADVRVVNSPLKYSRTSVEIRAGADAAGGHTRSLLREKLGLSDEQITRLAEEHIVELRPE